MKFVNVEPSLRKGQKTRQSASYVRRTFQVYSKLQCATLRITALGVYTGFLNGKRLGTQYLTPGYTDYRYRVQFQEYDVTDMLTIGDNVLEAVVGEGWYKGSIGISSARCQYGNQTALGFELALQYEDGTMDVLEADEHVMVSKGGPLRENDLKVIEKYDARLELSESWCWEPARPIVYKGSVVPEQGEAIQGHEILTPKVLHTPKGETVLDFHQNHSGHVKFHVTGRAGTEVRLTMGETLDEQGNFTIKNLVAEGAAIISGEVGQQLVYILKEGPQSYEPEFLISGYRYVKVENWPEPVRADNFRSVAIYSDLPETGTFSCSNPLINRLVQNSIWSRKSNFVDIPTDCPTRERAGWTGDINVYGETAMYLTDPRKFLGKWMQDFRLEQQKNGRLPYVVPSAGYSHFQWGCCGWSDALVNLTWTMYQFYGDKRILEENYEAIKAFIHYQRRRAGKDLVIGRGYHYGEWLEPGNPMYVDFIRNFFLPDKELTTAWFYQSTKQFASMAEALGKKRDARKYASWAEEIRTAYQRHFPLEKLLKDPRQCRLVRPIAMGLYTGLDNEELASELVRRIEKNRFRIGTGFMTTWKVLEVLTKTGHLETAYNMLENEECPGWLYEVKKGATTTWENWNGIDEHGVPTDSHNHFAPGAVVAWLFQYCAGIQPASPGFQEIRIAPQPGGSLTEANATYHSAVGGIESGWIISGQTFSLTVSTPGGIRTTVVLPDGSEHVFYGGTQNFHCILKKFGKERT